VQLIKQYGLQRSGSNALKSLIEINFEGVFVLSDYLGNKHEPLVWETIEENLRVQDPLEYLIGENIYEVAVKDVKNRHLKFIFSIKDPVSWINSYYKYQRKKFLYLNPNKEFPFNIKFCKRALSQWELNICSWLKYCELNPEVCVCIQHEEILSNPENKLKEIEIKFGLSRRQDDLVTYLKGYSKRGTDRDHGRDLINENLKFDRNYHLSGHWRSDIPNDIYNYASEYMLSFFDNWSQYKKYFQKEIFK
jgi:hypothetical protein